MGGSIIRSGKGASAQFATIKGRSKGKTKNAL